MATITCTLNRVGERIGLGAFRVRPSVLQWYLKRGDYDCCTGLSGLTETFMRFPRQIDMGKNLGIGVHWQIRGLPCPNFFPVPHPIRRYAEGGAVYHLYAIMVECDDHYLSYIRPEMEGADPMKLSVFCCCFLLGVWR